MSEISDEIIRRNRPDNWIPIDDYLALRGELEQTRQEIEEYKAGMEQLKKLSDRLCDERSRADVWEASFNQRNKDLFEMKAELAQARQQIAALESQLHAQAEIIGELNVRLDEKWRGKG